MILIITNKEDVHPTPVIDILINSNISFFRLNTEALLTDYEFSWFSNNLKCNFRMKNILNGAELRGSEITSVWDRRPELPSSLPISNSPEIDNHNLKEALGFLQFLRYYIKDIPSIGSIVNDRVASSKMLQLNIAKQIGFKTPDTCFANRKQEIIDFAHSYEYIILKSIESSNILNNAEGIEYIFYSQKVLSSTLINVPSEAFLQTVSYVQNYINKAYELRVTVVDTDIFACKINSQSQDDLHGKVDWRQGDDYDLKYELYNLPQEIADKCVFFVRRMGLNFGCFDFIVTPEYEYIFLECNPNGQWLWVELNLGLKISNSIANFLVK